MSKLSSKNIFMLALFIFIFSISWFYWKYPFTYSEIKLKPSKYNETIEKIHSKKAKNLKEVEDFIIHNQNVYGTLSSLLLAKKYILEKNLDKAFIQLNNSLKYTQEENLKNILKLRMAKIKIEIKEYKKAIEILASIENHNWDSIIENMKGDIFIKQNKKKRAIISWGKSLNLENYNAFKEIINMKINEFK